MKKKTKNRKKKESVDKHFNILEMGVEDFNFHREKNPDEQIYLSEREEGLCYGEFAGVNFSNGFLVRSNLKESNLTNANLRNANFKFANLDDTILSGADFFDTNLRGTSLLGTDITHAKNIICMGPMPVTGQILYCVNGKEIMFYMTSENSKVIFAGNQKEVVQKINTLYSKKKIDKKTFNQYAWVIKACLAIFKLN